MKFFIVLYLSGPVFFFIALAWFITYPAEYLQTVPVMVVALLFTIYTQKKAAEWIAMPNRKDFFKLVLKICRIMGILGGLVVGVVVYLLIN